MDVEEHRTAQDSRKGIHAMSDEKKYDGRDYCPLMSREYAQCHTTQMTSQAIPSVLRFCAGDYEACEIYQQFTAAGA